MDKVAIVILNWNGAKMLGRYLPSVLEHSEGAAVYVADNASTDDSLPLLRERFPQARLIELDRNWGFAEGYNKALARVDAEYYILLNSDVEVNAGWLAPLTDFMDNTPEAAACQPKLLAVHDRAMFEYAGACGGFIDKYGYPFCRGRIFDTIEKDNGQYDTVAELLWATGACLMVRAADYRAAGGLDGRFFAHNEEIDLCWRLRLRGRKIFCVPQSKVFHVGGGTLPKGNPRKTFLNFRNNLTMLYKNLPDGDLQSVMRVRLFLDCLAAVQALLLGRSWGDFKAIIRARREFNRWKHDFDKDRAAIQASCSNQDIKERKPYSILWQYYAKGIREYSRLSPSAPGGSPESSV